MSEKLAIIMPVYNEEEAIGFVIDKWVKALDQLNIDYTINPYNDGSKDSSFEVIKKKSEEYPNKVIAHDKKNSGHGPTILLGYREASAVGYDWVFQIDSDDEMGPEKFSELWEKRNDYDFLVGIRDGRKQALPRKIISAVSRLCVRLFYGKSVWDVNTPYRLMRVSAFKDLYSKIPENTFAPNVIISGMAAKLKLRCYEIRVPQKDRETGEVSIKKWKLFKAAAKSLMQTVLFPTSLPPKKSTIWIFSAFLAFLCVIQCSSFWEMIYGVPCSITDSSVFITISREMLDGALPYKDLFDHKGVYLYFINVLGLVTELCLVEFLFFLLSIFGLYKTLLLILNHKMSFFYVCAFPTFLFPFIAGGNRPEEYILPAIIFVLYYSIRILKSMDMPSILSTFFLGCAASYVFLLKFNYCSCFFAASICLIYVSIKRCKKIELIKHILGGLIGSIVGFLPALIYLFSNGIFYDFLDSYIYFNSVYGQSSLSIVSRLSYIVKSILTRYNFLVLLFPLIIIRVLFKPKKKIDQNDKLVALLLLLIIVLDWFLVCSTIQTRCYYLVPLIPVSILAIALSFQYFSLDKFNLEFSIFLILIFVFLPVLKGGYIGIVRDRGWRVEYVKNVSNNPKILEYLSLNDNKILVLGNNCLYYLMMDACPDNRYLFQSPISSFSEKINQELVDNFSTGINRLILAPKGTIKKEWQDALGEKYIKIKIEQDVLYVLK